ncbi:MAG TPA: RND family transporter [Mycobacterium sp.]|nr:RND family transporter [Mycobacterium sp.]
MSDRIGGGEAAKPGGMFDRLGDVVVRWPLLVIAAWVAVAGILFLAFPPLPVEASKHPQKALPDDAPTQVVAKKMADAFAPLGAPGKGGKGDSKGGGGDGANSMLIVLLQDERGITPADEAVYRKLVDKLHQDTQDNLSVQDLFAAPEMHDILASKDGKAFILPVTVPGDVQAPTTAAAFYRVREAAKEVTAGTTLTAYVSGPAATVVEATVMAMEDADFIAMATVFAVLIILIVIYRNIVTMFVPLLNIGICVATSQGVVSGLGEQGLPVNVQTIVLMTAVMVGAGTDYAVFLISRYHDYVRHGQGSDEAVKNALMSIGKVITASAGTVAVTFSAMVFTKLEVFSAVGPAISISIVVALLAALTFLPALLVLTGRRGWIKPRRELTTRMWRITGTRVVRRPRVHLAGSLIVLIALAACTSAMRFNYDDLKTMPSTVDSSKGYEAMNRHFPMNALTPMVMFVKSSRDLRTPTALADLEQVAGRVSQVPGITLVRGLTRPNGDPLEQMKLSFQAGEVGGKLDEASNAIATHGDDLDKLVNGSNELADALAQLRDQVTQSVSSLSGVVSTLTTIEQALGGDKTIAALDQGAQYTGQMKTLGQNLGMSTSNVQDIAAWAGPMLRSLNDSPECDVDPGCVRSRAGLAAIVAANNNGTLNSLKIMSRNLQAAQQAQTIGQTLDKVQQTLTQASDAMKTIKNLQATMAAAEQGSTALADGSRAIAGGVKQLVDQTRQLGSGLNEASSFLLSMKRDADKPNMAGFNLPPQITTRDEYKKGAQIFLAPDGHAARYFIQSALNPFTSEAMAQVDEIVKAAQTAQRNTELADASVSVVGLPSGVADQRDYYNDDISFIIIATLIIVFLILVALLRAIVAPLYLIGSVLLSYLAAMGIGVLVFQFVLGQNLHWSLPGLSFILLVAVGADYNMLLISRIRDESPHGVRVGVIRTVGSTGGVITSAGLIFAASMFGLMTASIYTMAEAGFVLGVGILIDTFLVRTITVPALASMIGQKNWWPSSLGKSRAQMVASQEAKQRQMEHISGQLVRMKVLPSHKTQATSPLANGHAGGERATTNGKRSIQRVPNHALPLFDLSGVSHRLTDDLRDPGWESVSTRGKGGQPKAARYLGHSLPLFGPGALSHGLVTVGANGNGHADGNGSGGELTDPDTAQPLPVFGTNALPHQATNGNEDDEHPAT